VEGEVEEVWARLVVARGAARTTTAAAAGTVNGGQGSGTTRRVGKAPLGRGCLQVTRITGCRRADATGCFFFVVENEVRRQRTQYGGDTMEDSHVREADGSTMLAGVRGWREAGRQSVTG